MNATTRMKSSLALVLVFVFVLTTGVAVAGDWNCYVLGSEAVRFAPGQDGYQFLQNFTEAFRGRVDDLRSTVILTFGQTNSFTHRGLRYVQVQDVQRSLCGVEISVYRVVNRADLADGVESGAIDAFALGCRKVPWLVALARAWQQIPSQTSYAACDMVLAFAGHLKDEKIKADVADQAVARFIRHLQDRGLDQTTTDQSALASRFVAEVRSVDAGDGLLGMGADSADVLAWRAVQLLDRLTGTQTAAAPGGASPVRGFLRMLGVGGN